MKQLVLVLLFIFANSSLSLSAKEEKPLRSGPMVCYVEMREAMIWVQTHYRAKVKAQYWDSTDTKKILVTNTFETEKRMAFTAKIIADEVQPGRTYFYEIFIDDRKQLCAYPTFFRTPKQWKWLENLPFFIGDVGSCLYGNETYYTEPSMIKELEDIGNELDIKNVALTFVPSLTDTTTEVFFNKINPDVENTFIVYQQGEIIDKYVNLPPTPDNYKRIVSSVENTMKEFLNIKAPRHQ